VLVICWFIELSQLTQGHMSTNARAREAVGEHGWVQRQQGQAFGCKH